MMQLCLGCGTTLPEDAEDYGIEYCEKCAGIKTYTENDVREMMSRIALDFYKLGQVSAEIVDLNASVETYLKAFDTGE